MNRLLLALCLTYSITSVAYSQTAPEPSNIAKGLNKLLEGVGPPSPQVLEMAKQQYWAHYDDLRSKIGFMKYCMDYQLLDAGTAEKAADIYARTIQLLFYDKGASHRSYNRESGDEAERQGSLGIIYFKDWGRMMAHAEPGFHPPGKTLNDYAKLKGGAPAASSASPIRSRIKTSRSPDPDEACEVARRFEPIAFTAID